MMSGNMGNTGKTGKIRKPTRGKPFGHPSHGQESDSERETGGSHQPTTHQLSRPQHKPSMPARQDDRPDQAPVQRPKIKVRRPGDPSAGGIHIGGKGDDEDGHGAQAGRGDHPTGRDHPSGGLDDSPGAEFGPSSGSDTKPKAKPKPKPKPTGKGTGDRNDDEESAVSGNEAGHDPQAGRKPGGQHGTDEQSDEGEQPKDQPKPKPKPKPKPSGGGNRSEEEGDGTGDGRPLGGQPSGLTGQERLRKGQKHPKEGNVDEDEDVEKTDLGNEPERIPVKKADASASSKVPDAFDDEGDDELTRIQRRINAIRKGGRANGVAVAEDDPDLEVADMELFEKFAVTAAERQKRMKKMLMLNDPETQIDIANALTEAVKSKWPDYVAMGFKVAFFIGDVALIATGTTDEFYLVDIPAKAIIEGAVNLYTRLTETPEEKEAAIRNGRGESAEKLEQRRLRGEVALMKLTGVEKLSKQQRETYDRLRGLLAMQRKAENAEGP